MRGMVKINNIEVPTKKKTFTDCNVIECEVGTTGHKGGDSGHGGRTYFKLRDLGSTDMRVGVKEWCAPAFSHNDAEAVVIAFGGDSELDTFIDALEFAVSTLKEMKSRK